MTEPLKKQVEELIEWLIEDFEKGDYDVTVGVGKVIAEVLGRNLNLWAGLELWELVEDWKRKND